MRRTLWCLIAASALAFGSLSVACSDDPSGSPGSSSGSTSDSGPGPGPGPGPDGGPNPTDGGDAGCTFASYVIGLVSTQTTSSAQPDPSLGQQCSETTAQSELAPLFP